MKTAHQIFTMLGAPIALSSADYGPNRYTGFRAFSEADIKLIQDEAFKAGMTKAQQIAVGWESAHAACCAILAERDKLP